MEAFDLPLFPLHTVLFPGMPLPLQIFEQRYKKMVDDCLRASMPFGVVLIRSGSETGPPSDPFRVGTTALIARVEKLLDGRLYLIAVGGNRFEVEDIVRVQPYYVARVHYIEDMDADADTQPIRRLTRELETQFGHYIHLVLHSMGKAVDEIELPKQPDQLTHVISAAMGIPLQEKQQLLEMTSVEQRLRCVLGLVNRQNVYLRSVEDAFDLLEGRRDQASFCPFSLN